METLTDLQKQVLIGLMLGDGCLAKRREYPNSNAFLSINRQLLDEDYVKWTHTIFSNLCCRDYYNMSYFHKIWNKTYFVSRMTTRALPCFTDFYNKWYPNDKKIIPLDLKEQDLTDIVLAIWFMDDGTCYYKKNSPEILQIRLYTNGFSKEEVVRLQKLLSFRLGEFFTIGTTKDSPDQYIIIGSNAAARAYFKAIDNVVVECMNRKFKWRNQECNFYSGYIDTKTKSRNEFILENELAILNGFYNNDKLTIPEIAKICNWIRNSKYNINPTKSITRYLKYYENNGLILKTDEFIFHKGRVYIITENGKKYVEKYLLNKAKKDLLFDYIPLARSKHGPK
jgi:hypothetical protein